MPDQLTLFPMGREARGLNEPSPHLWYRYESRPDPERPGYLIVDRKVFKSLEWICDGCGRRGRTRCVPVDGPDPELPEACKCGAPRA